MASGLLDLSTELLHNVLTYVEPVDLATLSQACRPLRSYINSTRLLWKELYLNRYDDPKLDVEPSWQDELQRTIQLEKILECTDRDVKRSKIEFVAEQSMRLLQRAKVNGEGGERNIELLTDFFETADNQDALLCSSSLYDRSGTSRQHAAPTPELRQFSAKLHCLFGRPIDPVPSRRCHPYFGQSHVLTDHILSPDSSPSANTRRQSPNDIPVHWVARAKVYDLRQYTEHNLWGPFMDDGSHRVDWEKVEAIMVVLGYNMNLFRVRSDGRFPYVWDTPWRGAIPKSFRSPPPRPKDDNDISKEDDGSTVISNMIQHALKNPQQIYGSSDIPSTLQPTLASLDPYGVTGTWIRVVCFLDYNDLYTFNFSSPVDSDEPRRPIDTQEGIIDLTEQLEVTKIDPPGTGDDDDDDGDGTDGMDWSSFKGERLPVVRFRGDSRSMRASWDPNANSRIRGTVRQTPEGEIRWTTFSIFHGEERWRSEGIQVGGLQSARGVLGNWFDKDFDIHGPAGPTAFWKQTDELVDEQTSDGMAIAFF